MTQVNLKIQLTNSNPLTASGVVRKVILDSDGYMVAKYGLTGKGRWVEVAEGTHYPDKCVFSVEVLRPYFSTPDVMRENRIMEVVICEKIIFIERMAPIDSNFISTIREYRKYSRGSLARLTRILTKLTMQFKVEVTTTSDYLAFDAIPDIKFLVGKREDIRSLVNSTS